MKQPKTYNTADFIAGIKAQNTTILAKAISLIESNLPEKKASAAALLNECLKINKSAKKIGISGVPGVGKSTFIEAFGQELLKNNQKIAILAVDPSSLQSGGSLLGDKTRMAALAANHNVFIRPSPSGKSLGGVAKNTYETILLCEAAGFDYIFIETVGVGQAEYVVKNMADLFVLLTLPVAGDELQGIKRGIMEVADIILINKSEKALQHQAEITANQLKEAIHFFKRPNEFWNPPVIKISALAHTGLNETVNAIATYFEKGSANGYLKALRKKQVVYWFEKHLQDKLLDLFDSFPEFQSKKQEILTKLKQEEISPFLASESIFEAFTIKSKK